MRRREFITKVGYLMAAWPPAARAQPVKRTFRIGYFDAGSPSTNPNLLASFQDGLRKLGYVEGDNLFLERRYAEGSDERLPQLAAEFVRSGIDVIFTIGLATALAAAKATSAVPIVFAGGGDPVAIGLIKSLSHPGGNVTGLSLVAVELAAKRIQLLKEIFPEASRVAVLWNPNYPINKLELDEATRAAGILGLEILPFEIYKREDLDGAFDAMVRERADALFLISSALTFPNRAQIAKLAVDAKLPTLVPVREYVEAGLMASYGPSFADHCRKAAVFVDQILRGARPADLPVQLPTRLEFVINAKAAKAIGFRVSPVLVTRAEDVIE